jgi:hypothetical protein
VEYLGVLGSLLLAPRSLDSQEIYFTNNRNIVLRQTGERMFQIDRDITPNERKSEVEMKRDKVECSSKEQFYYILHKRP